VRRRLGADRPARRHDHRHRARQRFPPAPAGPDPLIAIGDAASLPAVNSPLAAYPTVPAVVFFEGCLDGLPLHAGPVPPDVREIPRKDAGGHLVERVRADLPGLLDGDPYVWIACDAATIRTLASYVRKELAVPRGRVHALGYWRAEPGA
jgi:NADPH-dependent ferric siderophore reductase